MGRASNRKKARRLAGRAARPPSRILQPAAGSRDGVRVRWAAGSWRQACGAGTGRSSCRRPGLDGDCRGSGAVASRGQRPHPGGRLRWPPARPSRRQRVLDVLAPIVEAELAYDAALERWHGGWPDGEEDKPEFPDLEGPVFRLGGCGLLHLRSEAAI
jgi:hypothetical protein